MKNIMICIINIFSYYAAAFHFCVGFQEVAGGFPFL
jgi:hypothetical protein